jgi:hypothetical protein
MVPRQSIVPLKGVPQYLALSLATVPVEKLQQGNGNIPERLLFAMSAMLV